MIGPAEPVENRIGAEPAPQRDALAIVTVFAVLLMAVPSRLTVGALGGAGAPATLAGLVAFGGWLFLHVSRVRPRAAVVQPVRAALLCLVGAALASFVVAAVRPGGGVELRTSMLSVVVLMSWVGVGLMAADFFEGWATLSTLIDRLTVLAGLYASLGIAQFFTAKPLTDVLTYLPGLSLNQNLVSIMGRDGLVRVSSTAIHSIEFGVTMVALLPLCLHVLLHGAHLPAWRRWFPTAAVVAAIPLSISRSAIVTGAVILLVLLPTWPARQRWWTMGGLLTASVAVFVTAPGLLGTIERLFTGIGNDSSALSRTDSYGTAREFIAQNPLTGRGFGTFLPGYRILDNQYLLSMIDMGAVGVLALLALFVSALGCAAHARRLASCAARRDLIQALAASVLSVAVGFAFFDALSFPQYAGVAFLVVGMVGSVWRLTLTDRDVDNEPVSLTGAQGGARHPRQMVDDLARRAPTPPVGTMRHPERRGPTRGRP